LGVPKKKTAVLLTGDDGAKAMAVPESKAHNSARTSNDEAIIRSIVCSLILFCGALPVVLCAGMDTSEDRD
jgi:hypothetical protein